MKTRAELAREALMAKMSEDYMGNLGLNESYRQGLDDMVAWIDIEKCCEFHNRLRLKFPDDIEHHEECGMAGMGVTRDNPHRLCCENCPEREGIAIKPQKKKSVTKGEEK